MKTIILAGGAGTRLSEETVLRPKPMVEIGEHPILWHIMQIYSFHGFSEFLVALGYKGDVIKDYFLNFYARNADVTVRLGRGENQIHTAVLPRLDGAPGRHGPGDADRRSAAAALPMDRQASTFMMTYGDGVADVDLKALVAFHRAHGKLATVTAVRPPARFGALMLDGDRVAAFAEKPQVGEGWINGGFFVLEPAGPRPASPETTRSGSSSPLNTLAARGELMAYRHDGFWQPMDTLREKRLLEELWSSGQAPWKIWK